MWETKKSQSSSQISESKLRDYEDSVLANLRRAEERKKLIEQMRKEDEQETWWILFPNILRQSCT